MLSKLVMILDKRKELPAKYKKLIESSGAGVVVSKSFENGLEYLNDFEPDMIIISDSLDTTLADACKRLRMLSYGARPCILALSKSEDLKDKLEVWIQGRMTF